MCERSICIKKGWTGARGRERADKSEREREAYGPLLQSRSEGIEKSKRAKL